MNLRQLLHALIELPDAYLDLPVFLTYGTFTHNLYTVETSEDGVVLSAR